MKSEFVGTGLGVCFKQQDTSLELSGEVWTAHRFHQYVEYVVISMWRTGAMGVGKTAQGGNSEPTWRNGNVSELDRGG